MTAVVAKMLLDEMDEMGTDTIHYRAQRISRRFLRHVIWSAYNYSEARNALRYSMRVMPMEGVMR